MFRVRDQVHVLAALAVATLGWRTAGATDTQLWITDGFADYAKAEASGVIVGHDGALTLGPRTASSPAESLSVIWALAVMGDGSVALAGNGGRIERWTEGGGVRPWVRLPVGQVLALARDGDGLVAGTGPEGLVYRIGARGDTSLVARTGERYVWGVAPAGRGAWYAATGTRGRLLRIEGNRVRVVLDSDESNLVSLIPDGRGGAFAGGDSKGRVFHVRGDGSLRTAFDAAEDEIRSLALGADGALYAAALSASAVSEDDAKDEAPQPVKSAVTGARAVVYRIVPDSSAATHFTSPQPFVFALARTKSGILAATGNRASVFELAGPHHAAQWLAAPQGQITALAVDAGQRVYAAASNPAVLWRLGPDRAERGELLSPALDARRFASFGRVRWLGEARGGRVQIETRSGNTDPPDTTWSRWERGAERDHGFRVPSPSARYLQWKLTLQGGEPRVETVEAAYRERNLPPRVEELAVAPQGTGFREGDLQPRSEPVTQTLSGGQRVEYSISTTSQTSLRALPVWARGLRTLQWRGTDPNGDAMRYRIDVRPEGESEWLSVGKDLEATSFTWDTSALPDGRYRVRVQASDSVENPLGEELTGEALSEPFTVDNTPPAVTELLARGERGAAQLSGRAEDGGSTLSRLEVSLDDGAWRPVSPEGGLADDKALSFRARLADLEPGEHTISFRAVDRAGNTSTRAVRVTIPAAR
ncbi:MAG TPA: hypothetical protein VEY91_05230 [Candidatus Limnocylindria bacterium]|nr:hypothetical protein [Candidatus Limnocylindria bacterium]